MSKTATRCKTRQGRGKNNPAELRLERAIYALPRLHHLPGNPEADILESPAFHCIRLCIDLGLKVKAYQRCSTRHCFCQLSGECDAIPLNCQSHVTITLLERT